MHIDIFLCLYRMETSVRLLSYLPADVVPGQRQHSEVWYHREVLGWYTGHQVTIQVEFYQFGITGQGQSVSLIQSNQAPLDHQFSNRGTVAIIRNDLQKLVGKVLYLLMELTDKQSE